MIKSLGAIPSSALTQNVTVPSGSAVSLTTTISANVTSKSLAAGTYLVWAAVNFSEAAATTTYEACGVNTTTATLPTQAGGGGVGPEALTQQTLATSVATEIDVLKVGPVTVTLAATTTLYLVANATFSAGAVSVYGTLYIQQINVP